MIQFHRHLAFPRNVYIHATLIDEARLEDCHYGVYAAPRMPLVEAQHMHVKMMIGELPKPPARVLVVGFGVGSTVRALRKIGHRPSVITSDVNEARIANRNPIEGVTVVEEALERRRPSKPPFDAVFAREVGPQLDVVTLMRSAHAQLGKGGRLVLAEELPVEVTKEIGKVAQVLGYSVAKSRSLGEAAAPTLDHYTAMINKHRSQLKIELRMSDDGIDQFLRAIADRKRSFKTGKLDYLMMTLLKT